MTIFKEPLLRHHFVATATADKTLRPVAIKTDGVGSQALDINATLNKIAPTIAGVWDLVTTSQNTPDLGNTLFVAHKNPSTESIIFGDDRRLVDPVNFAAGGKYRSILKLFIKYENLGDNQFAHGTGWLIRPDVMITAGHNVYSWKSNAGSAREIVAYAGYNGSSSADSPAVQMRKAKRVVTTSQWLSNRGSMAHDFALVQFDRPFDDATPFQYIETPPEGDLVLGVVGYPADKIDQETGEKGGRMYELFEQTKYNIKEQRDTMLEHYIDSEGGNSGGPVLRGSDLTAIATHVYGGDTNTASILGRYGNPVQDYIAALNMPLPNLSKINLVTVSSNFILQSNAATGLQVKEIDRLGENVIDFVSAGESDNFLFGGIYEILKTTSGFTEILGPDLTSSIGVVSTPAIIWTLKSAQSDSNITNAILRAGMHRAFLANSALLVEVQKYPQEKAFITTLMTLVEVAEIFSGSSAQLRYDKVMHEVGVQGRSAKELADIVDGEVARSLSIRALSSILDGVTAKPESSINYVHPHAGNSSGALAASYAQEGNVASRGECFATKLGDALMEFGRREYTLDANAAKLSSKKGPASQCTPSLTQELTEKIASSGKEKAPFDDCMEILAQVTECKKNNSSTDIYLGPARLSVKVTRVSDAEKRVGNSEVGGRSPVNQVFFGAATEVETSHSIGRTFGQAFGLSSTNCMLDLASKATGSKRAETISNDPEMMVKELKSEIRKISQALIMRHILADRFLTAKMNKPATELREEGFFDNAGGLIKNIGKAVTDPHGSGVAGVLNEMVAHQRRSNNSIAADLVSTLLGIVSVGTNEA